MGLNSFSVYCIAITYSKWPNYLSKQHYQDKPLVNLSPMHTGGTFVNGDKI